MSRCKRLVANSLEARSEKVRKQEETQDLLWVTQQPRTSVQRWVRSKRVVERPTGTTSKQFKEQRIRREKWSWQQLFIILTVITTVTIAASYWYLEGAQWLTTEAKDAMNTAISLLSSEQSQEMAQIALWPVYMYCAGGTVTLPAMATTADAREMACFQRHRG